MPYALLFQDSFTRMEIDKAGVAYARVSPLWEMQLSLHPMIYSFEEMSLAE